MIYIFPNFPDLEFTDPTITVDPVVSNLDPENMTVDVNVFIERTGDIKGRYGLDINPVKVNDLNYNYDELVQRVNERLNDFEK